METEVGSDAAVVFARLRYQEVGRIPGYVITQEGQKKDEVIFYKDLAT